jgi:hypothetical protein
MLFFLFLSLSLNIYLLTQHPLECPSPMSSPDPPNKAAMEHNAIQWLYTAPITPVGSSVHSRSGLGLAAALRYKHLCGPEFGAIVVTFGGETGALCRRMELNVNVGLTIDPAVPIDAETMGPPAAREIRRIGGAHSPCMVAVTFQFVSADGLQPRMDIVVDLEGLLDRLTSLALFVMQKQSIVDCDPVVGHPDRLTNWPPGCVDALRQSWPELYAALEGCHHVEGDADVQATRLVASVDAVLDAYVRTFPCEWLHLAMAESITFIGSYACCTCISSGPAAEPQGVEEKVEQTKFTTYVTPCTETILVDIMRLNRGPTAHAGVQMVDRDLCGTVRTQQDITTLMDTLAAGIPLDSRGNDMMKPVVEMLCFATKQQSIDALPHDVPVTASAAVALWAPGSILDVVHMFLGDVLTMPSVAKQACASILATSIKAWCLDHGITRIVVWYPSCIQPSDVPVLEDWWGNCMRMDRSVVGGRSDADSWPWFEVDLTTTTS